MFQRAHRKTVNVPLYKCNTQHIGLKCHRHQKLSLDTHHHHRPNNIITFRVFVSFFHLSSRLFSAVFNYAHCPCPCRMHTVPPTTISKKDWFCSLTKVVNVAAEQMSWVRLIFSFSIVWHCLGLSTIILFMLPQVNGCGNVFGRHSIQMVLCASTVNYIGILSWFACVYIILDGGLFRVSCSVLRLYVQALYPSCILIHNLWASLTYKVHGRH